MKNARKLIALIAAAAMALSMCACSGSSSGSSSSGSSTSGSASSGSGSSSGSAAQAPETSYVLKLHTSSSETDSIGLSALKFKELVEERTKGQVTIEYYPSGTLGKTPDCIEGLKLRVCDIVFDGISNLAALDELANLDGVPYMYRDLDQYYAVFDGEVGQEYLKTLGENTDKVLLGYMCSGIRQLTSTYPIRTPADLKGLKMRVPAVAIYSDSWSWLGASPMPIAASDIYTSLNQNIIDGQENPYPTCVALSVHEVCKYVTETNHVFTTLSFMMDREFYESMPDDIRQILLESVQEAGKYGTEYAFQVSEEKKQVMIDSGCEIIEVDVADWQAALDGFLDSKYPYLKDWAERIMAVQ